MQGTLLNIVSPANIRTAERLKATAAALDAQIEAKRHPAIASQNPTARRARIAASMREDADKLEQIQTALYAVAQRFEEGTRLPDALDGIRWSRAVVDEIITVGDWKEGFKEKKEALLGLCPPVSESSERERRIAEMEMDLLGRRIPGYFPTPRPVVELMLDYARIEEGMQVLEPSAGKGDIADAIREMHGIEPAVVELNYELRAILEARSHNVVGIDVFEHSGMYDRIVMNPPFEKGADVDHVRHAYQMLNQEGVLVSIMCEGPFFRKDKKSETFREWLDAVGYSERLPEGSFKPSGTGVNTRIVVIERR